MVTVKSGLLSKRGNAGFKSFVDRFVILRKTEKKTVIAYYKVVETEEHGTPLGALQIYYKSQIVVNSEKYKGKEFVFAVYNRPDVTETTTITTQTAAEFEATVAKNEGSIFIFAAKNAEDLKDWTESVQAQALATKIAGETRVKVDFASSTNPESPSRPRPVASNFLDFQRTLFTVLEESPAGKAEVRLVRVGKKTKVRAIQIASAANLHERPSVLAITRQAGDLYLVQHLVPSIDAQAIGEAVGKFSQPKPERTPDVRIVQVTKNTLFHIAKRAGLQHELLVVVNEAKPVLAARSDRGDTLKDEDVFAAYESAAPEQRMMIAYPQPTQQQQDNKEKPYGLEVVEALSKHLNRSVSQALSTAAFLEIVEDSDDEDDAPASPSRVAPSAPASPARVRAVSSTAVSAPADILSVAQALTASVEPAANFLVASPLAAAIVEKQGNAGFRSWTSRAVAVANEEVLYFSLPTLSVQDAAASNQEKAIKAIYLAGGAAACRGRLVLTANTAVWAGKSLEASLAADDNTLTVMVFDCPKVRTAAAVPGWSFAAAKAIFDSCAADRKMIIRAANEDIEPLRAALVAKTIALRAAAPQEESQESLAGSPLRELAATRAASIKSSATTLKPVESAALAISETAEEEQEQVVAPAAVEEQAAPQVVATEAPIAAPAAPAPVVEEAAAPVAAAPVVSAAASAPVTDPNYPSFAFAPLPEGAVTFPAKRHEGLVVGVVVPATIFVEGASEKISAEVPAQYTSARWSYRSLVEGFDLVVLECPANVVLPVLSEAIQFPAVEGVHPGLVLYPHTADISDAFCSVNAEQIKAQHASGLTVEQIEANLNAAIRNAVCSLGMSLGERRLAFAPPQEMPVLNELLAAVTYPARDADRHPFVEGAPIPVAAPVTPSAASPVDASPASPASEAAAAEEEAKRAQEDMQSRAGNNLCFCIGRSGNRITVDAEKGEVAVSVAGSQGRRIVLAGGAAGSLINRSVVAGSAAGSARAGKSLITKEEAATVQEALQKIEADNNARLCC